MDSEGGGTGGWPVRHALTLGGGISILLLFLGLLAIFLPGTPEASLSPEAGEIQRLRRETRALELELELASAPTPYLVLDVPGGKLTLKASGVVLRPFLFLSAEARGGERMARRNGGIHPMDTIWREGDLRPGRNRERRVILSDSVVPPDPSGSVAFIPPTPEEETPPPPAFRLVFRDGFSVLVRVQGRGRLERMFAWFRLAPWQRDTLRLEVTMSPEEAGALYRAFAPGTPALALGASMATPDSFSPGLTPSENGGHGTP